MVVTDDVDEALYRFDRIVTMTDKPYATSGEILEVPFPHPRNCQQLPETNEYYELQNQDVNILGLALYPE